MPEKMTRNVFRKKKFYAPTPHIAASNIGGNKIPNENKVVANFLCPANLLYLIRLYHTTRGCTSTSRAQDSCRERSEP